MHSGKKLQLLHLFLCNLALAFKIQATLDKKSCEHVSKIVLVEYFESLQILDYYVQNVSRKQ